MTPTLTFTTPWVDTLRKHYAARASNQFILHGNVNDLYLLPNKDNTAYDLSDLDQCLKYLTSKIDIVLSYSIDRGLRVVKGMERAEGIIKEALIKPTYNPNTALPILATILRQLTRRRDTPSVAFLIYGLEDIMPSGNRGLNYDLHHLVATIRSWTYDSEFTQHPFLSILVTNTLHGLHEQITQNTRSTSLLIDTPSREELLTILELLKPQYPHALGSLDLEKLATGLSGVTASNLLQVIRLSEFDKLPLDMSKIGQLKKDLIEKDTGDLLEFIPPRRTLDDLAGMEPVKDLFRTYIHMWHSGQTQRFPKGLLASGPVGTGKTYLAECLGGSIGFPTVKLKNFRDKWMGSTEANLERIFRALRALAPCLVFVDEADQTLGKRDNSGSSDGGLSGRIYSAIAQEMSDPSTRGKILWMFATSRADLIEVDLKRPGRMDVKLALMPTGTQEESLVLLKALMRRDNFLTPEIEAEVDSQLTNLPIWLTPGAAESICAEIYSGLAAADRKGNPSDPAKELVRILKTYQPPVRQDIMEQQIRIAANECSRLDLLPMEFRQYSNLQD